MREWRLVSKVDEIDKVGEVESETLWDKFRDKFLRIFDSLTTFEINEDEINEIEILEKRLSEKESLLFEARKQKELLRLEKQRQEKLSRLEKQKQLEIENSKKEFLNLLKPQYKSSKEELACLFILLKSKYKNLKKKYDIKLEELDKMAYTVQDKGGGIYRQYLSFSEEVEAIKEERDDTKEKLKSMGWKYLQNKK
ncbi:hypothetical protein KAI54_02595 [Candidatus Gracilibacteria bacterium]|nr:hypothetical protein [Candidatus Gracilibacteria bacterium]